MYKNIRETHEGGITTSEASYTDRPLYSMRLKGSGTSERCYSIRVDKDGHEIESPAAPDPAIPGLPAGADDGSGEGMNENEEA